MLSGCLPPNLRLGESWMLNREIKSENKAQNLGCRNQSWGRRNHRHRNDAHIDVGVRDGGGNDGGVEGGHNIRRGSNQGDRTLGDGTHRNGTRGDNGAPVGSFEPTVEPHFVKRP